MHLRNQITIILKPGIVLVKCVWFKVLIKYTGRNFPNVIENMSNMLGGNMSYLYEILKNGENDMKEVEALQGCSHLKASRRNMNQEK